MKPENDPTLKTLQTIVQTDAQRTWDAALDVAEAGIIRALTEIQNRTNGIPEFQTSLGVYSARGHILEALTKQPVTAKPPDCLVAATAKIYLTGIKSWEQAKENSDGQ